MKSHSLAAWVVLVIAASSQAAEPCLPVCEPGYTIVEEIEYRECVRKVCKVVTEVKKTTKPVYSCKEVDYCLPKCPPFGCKCKKDCCQEECLTCDKPRTKKVLVKKLVTTECPIQKCVVETIVERVPCKVYRKVPCGTAAPAEAIPAPK